MYDKKAMSVLDQKNARLVRLFGKRKVALVNAAFAIHAKRGRLGQGHRGGTQGNKGKIFAEILLAETDEKGAEEGEKHLDPAEEIVFLRGAYQ